MGMLKLNPFQFGVDLLASFSEIERRSDGGTTHAGIIKKIGRQTDKAKN